MADMHGDLCIQFKLFIAPHAWTHTVCPCVRRCVCARACLCGCMSMSDQMQTTYMKACRSVHDALYKSVYVQTTEGPIIDFNVMQQSLKML